MNWTEGETTREIVSFPRFLYHFLLSLFLHAENHVSHSSSLHFSLCVLNMGYNFKWLQFYGSILSINVIIIVETLIVMQIWITSLVTLLAVKSCRGLFLKVLVNIEILLGLRRGNTGNRKTDDDLYVSWP